jgi:hypothetical protein
MKIFILLFIIIPFVVCSDFDITLDNLTNSYDKVKRSYFKYKMDKSFIYQSYGSHSRLKNFLVKTYKTDAVGLFQQIEKSQNFHLCFIVIGCLQLSLNNKISCHLWEDLFSPQSDPKATAKKFFVQCKDFMHMIVRREDWAEVKKILEILLSLQKKFLPRLESDSETKVVERRLAEYKFLYDRFDPSDSNAFLDTFIHLKSMALDYNGDFLKNPLIRKFIKLFKIYKFHFLSYEKKFPWDPSKLDQKFLYFLIFRVKYCDFFDYMKTPYKFPLLRFKDYQVFRKTFKVYEDMVKPQVITINNAMENGSSDFIKFLHESIDSNIFYLNYNENWLLKAILRLIPIYID